MYISEKENLSQTGKDVYKRQALKGVYRLEGIHLPNLSKEIVHLRSLSPERISPIESNPPYL